MKKPAALLALATTFALVTPDALSCTNILVTKGASADGSTMITYAKWSLTLSRTASNIHHVEMSWLM